jgi:hypothetical protein
MAGEELSGAIESKYKNPVSTNQNINSRGYMSNGVKHELQEILKQVSYKMENPDWTPERMILKSNGHTVRMLHLYNLNSCFEPESSALLRSQGVLGKLWGYTVIQDKKDDPSILGMEFALATQFFSKP